MVKKAIALTIGIILIILVGISLFKIISEQTQLSNGCKLIEDKIPQIECSTNQECKNYLINLGVPNEFKDNEVTCKIGECIIRREQCEMLG